MERERGKENMKTTIRPEVSKKNSYWINNHRYHELKYFCLQYYQWKSAYDNLDSYVTSPAVLEVYFNTSDISDPTAKVAESKLFFRDRMEMIEQTAIKADPDLAKWLIEGVTRGVSYTYLRTKLDIPCNRNDYYELYRKFFWLLSKERK